MTRLEFQGAIKAQGFTMQEVAESLNITRSALYYTLDKGNWSESFKEKVYKLYNIEYIPPRDGNGNTLSFLEQRRLNLSSVYGKSYMVPMVPVKAQAGYSKSFGEPIFIESLEHYAVPPGVTAHGAIWRYWEIEGESMEPTFHNKDIILTSQVNQHDWENVREYYVYVIVTEEKVMIKRVYPLNSTRWVLISDNEDNYQQQLIEVQDIKELWVFRRHINSKAPVPKKFKINFK